MDPAWQEKKKFTIFNMILLGNGLGALVMVKILLKGSFNEDGYKGAVNDPADREIAARQLFKRACLEVESFYFSPTAGCQFVIMEGDVTQLAAAEFAFMSSGAFMSVEAHILITGSEMTTAQKLAGNLVSDYDAPNRDEIDRMLIEE